MIGNSPHRQTEFGMPPELGDEHVRWWMTELGEVIVRPLAVRVEHRDYLFLYQAEQVLLMFVGKPS